MSKLCHINSVWITLGLTVFFSGVCLASNSEALRGISAAENFAALPILRTGTQVYQFSSTDPAEGQFDDFGHWLSTNSDGGAVLADIRGPGTIYRIWSTGNDGQADRLQIYLDGHTTPDIDSSFNEFHSHPPLRDRPQVGSGGENYRAWWSYLPIPFTKSCKIIRQGNFRPFHNITYHTYTTAEGVTTWSPQQNNKALEEMWTKPQVDPKNTDGNVTERRTVKLKPGETRTIFERTGSGYVASLRIGHYLPEKGLRIRMFWDGQSVPAVDSPLKWFFGSVDKGGDVKALGVGTIDNSGYCYFPMPFWRNARIELVNLSESTTDQMDVEVQFNKRAYIEDATGYFCAYATDTDRPGDHYTCLRARGHGHVVGMAKRMPAGGHACEGNEQFYIDDRRYPDLYGTGEEDYNNCAWWENSYNSYPTHGCIGNDCYYRIHFPDLLVFEQSIDMEFESWEDYYIASVVWYYSKDRPSLAETDTIDIGDAGSEAKHLYQIVDQTWSGEKDGIYPGKRFSTNVVHDNGRSFSGSSSFTANLDPLNHGVRLRVRTEHTNYQSVNVWVDDILVAERPWAIIKDRFDALWIDSDFEIPAKYTSGKAKVRIKLEHEKGTPNWTEYRYDVFSYR